MATNKNEMTKKDEISDNFFLMKWHTSTSTKLNEKKKLNAILTHTHTDTQMMKGRQTGEMTDCPPKKADKKKIRNIFQLIQFAVIFFADKI